MNVKYGLQRKPKGDKNRLAIFERNIFGQIYNAELGELHSREG